MDVAVVTVAVVVFVVLNLGDAVFVVVVNLVSI